jgi:hypothetical protein
MCTDDAGVIERDSGPQYPTYLFAPFADVRAHTPLEHAVAEASSLLGRRVVVVECAGALDPGCIPMMIRGTGPDASPRRRRAVCSECRYQSAMRVFPPGADRVSLDSQVVAGDLNDVEAFLESVNPSNWRECEFDGLPIGKWAAYSVILHSKSARFEDNASRWAEYLSEVRSCALTSRAIGRLQATTGVEVAAVYNVLYPVNRVFWEVSKRNGARLVNFQWGPAFANAHGHATLYTDVLGQQTLVDSQFSRESMEVSLSDEDIAAVESQISEFAMARHHGVYSAEFASRRPQDVRGQLGLRAQSKVLVALGSSEDEDVAAAHADALYRRDPLAGHATYEEYLGVVLRAAEKCPEYDFVFRVHPRLFPNKREGVLSPQVKAISEQARNGPLNLHLNLPSDEIDLYSLMRIASASINFRSTAGLEFDLLGIPTVLYDADSLNAYPSGLDFVAERGNMLDFLDCIQAALERGWSLQSSISAFRWGSTRWYRAPIFLTQRGVFPTDWAKDTAVAPRIAMSQKLRGVTPEWVLELARSWRRRRNRRPQSWLAADWSLGELSEALREYSSPIDSQMRILRQAGQSRYSGQAERIAVAASLKRVYSHLGWTAEESGAGATNFAVRALFSGSLEAS